MAPSPLLSIDQLHTAFPGSDGVTEILHGVSLTVNQGETVALVGESGSGKSVTALSTLGLLENARYSGKIRFQGKNLLALGAGELRRIRGNRIAMIFQEPMTSLNPVYTIGRQLIEPLLLHRGMTDRQAREAALQLLDRTGISEPEQRLHSYPHQLSGGQRQRVMIAMALACRPALLIADEPTTALDVTIEAQILALLQDLQQETGMAILLITHDLHMVQRIAEKVYIMHRGHIVEQGTTTSIFTRPRDPYTVKLLNSVPGEAPARQGKRPALLTIKDLHCSFRLKKGWLGKESTVRAVDGVSLTLRQGSTLGLVGESGSGKSTLGKCILGLVNGKGMIRYGKSNLLALKNHQLRPLRRDLQVVFQDPFSSLSPRMTIEQIVGEGLTVHKIGADKAQRRRLTVTALKEVGLEEEMLSRYPHEFSGGQRQRIAVARALVLKPKILILDEPTSALDMTIQAQLLDLLRRIQQRYQISYLFISHDLRVVRAMADDLAVMQNGRIVESGAAAGIFARPAHPYTRKLFAAAFTATP